MLNLFIFSGLENFLEDQNQGGEYSEIWYKALNFLSWVEKQWIGRFVLENPDAQFSQKDLHAILRSVFWFGRSGATKFNDTILPVSILDIKRDIKNKFISGLATSAYNFNNNVATWSKISKTLNIKVNKSNTSLLDYSSQLSSPFLEVIQFAFIYATAWEVYNKDLLLSQKMIVTGKSGANIEKGLLSKFKKFKLNLSTSQNNTSNSLTSGLFDKKQILESPDSFGSWQMTHSVDQYKKTIDNIKAEVSEIMGFRTNLNFKKERQIVGEIDYLDIYFDTMENFIKVELKEFFDNINKITMKNYTFKTVEEVKKEERKNEMGVANEQAI